MRIEIKSNMYTESKLREVIEDAIKNENLSEEITIEGEPGLKRSFEPSVTIALVSTMGTIVGALISGIVNAMNSRKMQKIIIEINKNKIEVPSDITKEKFEEIISSTKKLLQ